MGRSRTASLVFTRRLEAAKRAAGPIALREHHVARARSMMGNTDIVEPLAWLVLTFVGSGAVLVLKSFLQTIGSELGKKVVAHFTKRPDGKVEKEPRSHGIAVVFEIKPSLKGVIYIDSPALDRSQLPAIIERIQSEGETVEVEELRRARVDRTSSIIEAWYDRRTATWIVQHNPGMRLE